MEVYKQFEKMKEQNIMVLKSASENGKKTVGFYCTYGPQELAVAAGAYAVGLCGTTEVGISEAEADLPRNLCPLIKSSYGMAATDKCPYFYFSDLIVGETTCDGKKKMYELMKNFKNVHVMNIMHTQDSEFSVQLMKRGMLTLKEKIEECTNVKIKDDDIRKAIRLLNKEKLTLKRLFDLNKNKPALVSGTGLLKVSWQSTFHLEREERINLLEELCKEFEKNRENGIFNDKKDTPRILLTGVPTGVGSDKVLAIVEECGGNVVAFENCTGYKTVDLLVDEKIAENDPYLALAQRYMKIPCSIMSPNKGREEKLEKMVKEFSVDAVIDLTWQACHTYNIESNAISKLVKEKLGIPYLHIESDYSKSDWEQLKVRINALIEMI
jgi:benzoyl-CoA reductase/2-hydroxyglutaryl-CoA dehydratase subunit BcrC/BadD/HgdB